MRIKITDDDYEDLIEIRITDYGDYVYWELDIGYERNVRSGEIYNHDNKDVLGLISKIYPAVGKI